MRKYNGYSQVVGNAAVDEFPTEDVESAESPNPNREGYVRTTLRNWYHNVVQWYMRGDFIRTIFHYIHLKYRHVVAVAEPAEIVVAGSQKHTIVATAAISASSGDERYPLVSRGSGGDPSTSASVNRDAVTCGESQNSLQLTKHIWLSGQAIPLTDQDAIKRAIRLDGFLLGIKDYVNTLLPISFFALLTHDIGCYYLQPQDRYGNVWWQIFAGISPNQQTLTSYLNGFWWWPTVLLGTPFLLSSYQLLHRYNWHLLRASDVNATTNYGRNARNALCELLSYP